MEQQRANTRRNSMAFLIERDIVLFGRASIGPTRSRLNRYGPLKAILESLIRLKR